MDLPAMFEKSLKKEIAAVGPAVARAISPTLEKSISSAITESFQDALRSSLETYVIPAFEMSCKSMFEQIDATFQKGIREHTTTAQQQVEKSHSSVVAALQWRIGKWQRKLLAMAAAGANTSAGNPLVTQSSNGPLAHLHKMQPESHGSNERVGKNDS
ncbi:hypothetical protein F3Y22_tig00000778pilonHSYRG00380 [Hibiscus syriacus]|uniref:Uncharacterized protein n=1 Tax=Hibiscus syriacus TaxID=106335 RepID=A0A6A3D4E6_HIBSY|nr:hypothetical protein F3Y22_tig00000778pilonHSYRG00380 [Hibiscus syriacus]